MNEDKRILEKYNCGCTVIINPFVVKKKWF